jgi:hypothetical protein
MKSFKTLLFSTFLGCMILMFTAQVHAQATPDKGQAALGVMIGEPTGVSFKYWKSNKNAFDLGLAWSLQGNDAISIHGDYLWHSWLDVDKGRLALHYGVGARAWFAENASAAGVRIPLGLNYLFADAPIGLFVEIAPIIDIVPDTDADGSGGIGARFYF